MRKYCKLNLLLLNVLLMAFSVSGQVVDGGWVRLLSEDDKVEVSFPPDFIVDAEDHYESHIVTIYGYKNGTSMKLEILKERDGEQRIGMVVERQSEKGGVLEKDFSINKVRGVIFSNTVKNRNSSKIAYIATKKFFYRLTVHADTEDGIETEQFLNSVMVDGKAVAGGDQIAKTTNETISVKTLKSSPEVSSVMQKKSESTRKVQFELRKVEGFNEFSTSEKDTRPVIVLNQPYPPLDQLFKAKRGNKVPVQMKLLVQYLADGSIGHVVAYSDDTVLAGICVQAINKTKFIPAKKDNVSVDSVGVAACNIPVIQIGQTLR